MRRVEVGELFFELLQFVVELVVVEIRNLRARLDVVEVVVPADLVTQLGDSLLRFGAIHRCKRPRPPTWHRACRRSNPGRRTSGAGQIAGETRRSLRRPMPSG